MSPYGDNHQLDIENYRWRVEGDKALLTFQDDWDFSIPAVSLSPFVQDLTLDYSELPLSGVNEIDAIIEGDFELLGKGFDGIALRVGDRTVKVSTTVPFHPAHQAHRTPQGAINHSLMEADLFQELSEAVSCFPEIEVYEHAGRLWMVKPYLDLIEPEDMTAGQVAELEACLLALHDAGYALCDTLQVGVRDGEIQFLDVGQACPIDDDTRRSDLLELRHVAGRAGVELQNDALVKQEVIKLHKYLQFLLRAKADPEKIEERGEALREKYYALNREDQKELQHIEDFIWEEL